MVKLEYCNCGRIHVPDEVRAAVLRGEKVTASILPHSAGIAKNVLKWGTGAINVDASRIAGVVPSTIQGQSSRQGEVYGADQREQRVFNPAPGGRFPANFLMSHSEDCTEDQCSMFCAVKELDRQSGFSKSPGKVTRGAGGQHGAYSPIGRQENVPCPSDSGGASRFFATFRYVAKPSRSERNRGCDKALTWENQAQNLVELTGELNQLARDISADTLQLLVNTSWNTDGFGSKPMAQCPPALMSTIETVTRLITDLRTSSCSQSSSISASILDAIRTIEANGLSLAESVESLKKLRAATTNAKTALALGASLVVSETLLKLRGCAKLGNVHSTVKPLKLMRYLITMITPPGGICLDPFAGSGTTLVAAKEAGFQFIGIERESEYIAIAEKRMEAVAL